MDKRQYKIEKLTFGTVYERSFELGVDSVIDIQETPRGFYVEARTHSIDLIIKTNASIRITKVSVKETNEIQ